MKVSKRAFGAIVTVVALVAAVTPAAIDGFGSLADAAGTTPSVTTLVSSANPNVYGQSVTFTATVTGGAGVPTGTVTFFNGTSTASTKTLTAAGTASWSTTLPVGSASIVATYNGNATYALSNSPAVSQVTNKTPTTTTIAPSANPATVGSAITFTAFVAAAPPGSGSPSSGTVKFYDGATQIGSATPSTGTATATVSNLAVGAHSITAAFGGSASYNPSTTLVLALTVNAAPTSTALVATPDPAPIGSPVSLTATVSSASGTPSGVVTFSDGATVLGTAALAGGVAVISISALVVGDHSITAAYGGSLTFAASVSGATIETVGTAATVTTLAATPNPASFGSTVTLTATVASTGATPTGLVTFLDGSTALGSVALSSGQASFPTSSLAVGDHAVTASYGGSSTAAAGTSAATTVTVSPAATSAALVASQNPAPVGAGVTFTATISAASGTPSGTVTFLEGTTVLGTGTLASGQASISTGALAAGDHVVTASYEGDVNFAPSTSPALTETIGTAPTTTNLTAAPSPSSFGTSVTFTATVSSAAGSPTGTVTFAEGATVLGVASVAGGQASLPTAGLAVGDHVVTASYDGSALFGASSSAPFTQTVTTASTTTGLSATPNPAVLGDTVTLTATVTAAIGTPTGIVTFSDGTTVLGTGTLVSGQATLSTSALTSGAHLVTASYGSDAAYAPSTSVVVTEIVNLANTTTSVTATPNPSTYGGAVTYSATVTSSGGTPTGTVTFLDGTTVIGGGTLVGGQTTFTTSALAVGTHSITASYGGSVAFGTSTSGPLVQAVAAASTTVSLTASPNPSAYGSLVTFTATVASPGGIPAGTVTFLDGTSVIGTAALANGQAALGVSTLATGPHSVTASYATTANFTGSTSTTRAQTVNAAATSTNLGATPNPASAGTPVTLTAFVTSVGGTPSGTVTFSDGATVIGSGSLSNGQAALVTSTLTTGTHSITAAYVATTNFTASSSTALTETINAANLLFVDRGNVRCTNTGATAGTSATPYCTIGAAASKATAGMTVIVASGTYTESVTIKNSGTSTAPVTFTTAAGANVTVTGGTNGFVASSKSWIVIRGFTVTQTSGPGITVSSGTNDTVDGNHVSVAGLPTSGKTAVGIKFSAVTQSVISNNTTDHNSDAGIYVTGSNTNTIRSNTSFSNARGYVRAAAGIDVRTSLGNQVYDNVSHDNEDSGINAWTGTTTGSNYFYDNLTYSNGDHGIDVHDALNNRVIANTVYGNYDSGIEMTTSTGTVLANNVSVDNGINSARTAGEIRVDKASVATTTLNDDLVFLRVAGEMIDWNGVKYASLAAFQAATGQESRGIQADPHFVSVAGANFHLSAGSPAIDSANSGAPNQPSVDFDGAGRFDDPATVNTGIGPVAYVDRGAFEYHA